MNPLALGLLVRSKSGAIRYLLRDVQTTFVSNLLFRFPREGNEESARIKRSTQFVDVLRNPSHARTPSAVNPSMLLKKGNLIRGE